jgi:hypothetical protein
MSTVYNPLVDLGQVNPAASLGTETGASVVEAGSGFASFPSNAFSPATTGEELPGLSTAGLIGETAPPAESTGLGSGILNEVLSGGSPLSMLSPLGGGSATPFTAGSGVSRVVSIVLGLLLIGGGIIMFRPELGESAARVAAA